MQLEVSALSRFLLKSAAKESLEATDVTVRGFPLDREFMVTKMTDGVERLCTQRDPGREKLGQVTLMLDRSEISLSAPGMNELRIPTIPQEHEVRPVLVHSQMAEGIDQGQNASEWLTEYLGSYKGVPHRLVRQNADYVRRPNSTWVTQADARTAFADGYPILIISDESLLRMRDHMHEIGGSGSLESLRDRVRGNLYISSFGEPFLEDRVKQIKIGDVVLELVKPCSRCSIPGLNQTTGLSDDEGKSFSAALGKFRRGTQIEVSSLFPAFEKAELNKTFLGMNAVVVEGGGGSIKISDKVEILEMRKAA